MNPSLYKNRSFVSVWMGNGISELGGAFGTFCNSILIYQLTGSTLALGSMWLLYFIPSLILQLFIGPSIDRWSRKWIKILSQWTRGIVFVIPSAALLSGNLEVWHVYVVQCAVGLITPFYVPVVQFGLGVTMVTTLPYITEVLGGSYAEYNDYPKDSPQRPNGEGVFRSFADYQRRYAVRSACWWCIK